jgi:hypothetical protein
MHAYTDVELSREEVWPYVWEFAHMEGWVDNVEIDSIDGGPDWYDVKFTGDFPFVHTEVTNHKWIVKKGYTAASRMIASVIESPLPIKIIASENSWSIESWGSSKCRVHYRSTVKVDMAGMEGLYTGIAKRDGRRLMKNFKQYAEEGK